jgi:hypothetical protein
MACNSPILNRTRVVNRNVQRVSIGIPLLNTRVTRVHGRACGFETEFGLHSGCDRFHHLITPILSRSPTGLSVKHYRVRSGWNSSEESPVREVIEVGQHFDSVDG